MRAQGVSRECDQINAAALLLARGTPSQPALVSTDGTLSYRELRRSVAQAATLWQELGVQPGEVLMLRGGHGCAEVVAFLGAMWAGAVPVPLRPAEGAEAPVRYRVQRPSERRDGRAHAVVHPWSEWQPQLGSVPALAPVPRLPWEPACWVDPRSWDGEGARVLPHRFPLWLMARPGTTPLARAPTMLGVLRALRRGVTAVLHPPPVWEPLKA